MILRSRLSKLSTLLLATASALTLANCSHATNDELVITPGESGTFIALGAEVEGSIEGGTSNFDFSKTRGMSIGTAVGGPNAQNKDESKLFKPASITKLVTTALALKTLGKDFSYSTQVYYENGSNASVARNVVVVADGDPQVVRALIGDGVAQQPVFREISAQLRKQGVTRIEGSLSLLSADERRDAAVPADGMDDSDHTVCFGAVAQSFNNAWNCASLISKNGSARWADSNLDYPLESRGSGGGLKLTPVANELGRIAKFIVSGSGATEAPISDVKPWYARTLLSVLNQDGISSEGVTLHVPTGDEAEQMKSSLSANNAFTVSSEPLSELVRYTNKPSDNYFADSLFKTVAEKHGDASDLRTEGQAAVRQGVAKWLQAAGAPELSSEVRLVDGAGLSHENRVSARAYMTLLKQFTKEPTFPSLWKSLPIAATDGTLKLKMKCNESNGEVRAKTGTLKGSYQLAGYIPKYASDQRTVESYVPFVILSSVNPDQRFNVFDFQGKLASNMLKLLNPSIDFRARLLARLTPQERRDCKL